MELSNNMHTTTKKNFSKTVRLSSLSFSSCVLFNTFGAVLTGCCFCSAASLTGPSPNTMVPCPHSVGSVAGAEEHCRCRHSSAGSETGEAPASGRG